MIGVFKRTFLILKVLFVLALFRADAAEMKMIFTGDNLLGAKMSQDIAKNGYGFPYEFVKSVLHDSDITFGNLECPLTNFKYATLGKSKESIRRGKNFIFKAPPEYVEILTKANFDVVSLANNHMMDYCSVGLLDTIRALDSKGIKHAGAGKNKDDASAAAIIKEKGYTVGYLAYSIIVSKYSEAGSYTPGINAHQESFSNRMKREIEDLKKQVDIVVVSIHWGVERNYYPYEYQINIAHKCIDSGADVIVGHHPHRIQGIEIYKGGVVLYSLGNFLFPHKSEILESMLLRLTYKDKKLSMVEVIPAWVKEDGRPVISYDSKLVDKITSISSKFGTKFEVKQSSVFVKVD